VPFFSDLSLHRLGTTHTSDCTLIHMSITKEQRAVAYARAHSLQTHQVLTDGRVCATRLAPASGGKDWVWFVTDAEAAEAGLAVAARRIGETFLIDGETWHSIPA
jgi:hypothetical protein